MNVFDYFFENTSDLKKDFVVGSKACISYESLYTNSLRLASYLQRNFGEGNNIILLMPNSINLITAYLGILKSGNVCIPLNYAIEQKNLDYILKITDCEVVFVDSQLLQKLEIGIAKSIINSQRIDQIVQDVSAMEPFGDFDPEQLGEIIFTSGSTGEPKGVMISHKNIIANTQSIVEYLSLSSEDRMCVVLPFFYCYGLSLLHTHLRVGGSIVLNNNFIFLGSVINDIKNHKCTGFAGVPSHFQILLKKSQSFKTTTFPDLRYVTQAGGKLHAVFIKEFCDAFPEIAFFVMYGQTEATARLSYLPPNMVLKKTSSIGKAIPGVQLKIVDTQGVEKDYEEEGELIAKGNNIMMGYFKDDKGTRTTIKKGWLYTGDLAKKDKDGYFHILARKKEIIKVGGKRVSPKEIEEVILTIPEVVDCTLKGVEDDILGEAIEATIVLNTDKDADEMKEIILKTCSKKLALYKIPQKIILRKSMAMSLTGKKVKS